MLLANLPSIIFDQFMQMVEKASQGACFEFDRCNFTFTVVEESSHTLLNVFYAVTDRCFNQKNIVATIDITGICLSYLTSCKWVQYLTRIANQFVYDICPPIIRVVPQQNSNKCRVPPASCNLLPCKHEINVVKTTVPIIPKEKVEFVVSNCSSCVPRCEVAPPCVNKKYIIRYEQEKPSGCCGRTTYVQPTTSRHQFAEKIGSVDYNDHVWNEQCKCTTGCSSVKAY